jgi:hypothetical protein
LNVSPDLGVYNQAAFDTIDWAAHQSRQHRLRIMVPLVDDYVGFSRIGCAEILIPSGLLSWEISPSLARQDTILQVANHP